MPPLRAKRVQGGCSVSRSDPAGTQRRTSQPKSCGGPTEWFQVYMVKSILPQHTGVHVIEIPLSQEAIGIMKNYPTTPEFAKEVGGPLVPVWNKPNQPGWWVQFPFPDEKSYKNSKQNRVRVPAHWPLSFHSHPTACTKIPDSPGHEMCAIFTPSATDFGSLFENPANLSHIVANQHGMYAINTPLHTCTDKEGALREIQALQDRFARGEFGKGANEDKKYHRAYMDLCADLGLCVEFWPWEYRSKVGDSIECYPRLLVPLEKAHMLVRSDYPSEETWTPSTNRFFAHVREFIVNRDGSRGR